MERNSFFPRFLYKSSIVFHQNNFFELRWDYTSNIVSLQCRFFCQYSSNFEFPGQGEGGTTRPFLSLCLPGFLCRLPPRILDPLHKQVFINFQMGCWKLWKHGDIFVLPTRPLDSESYEDIETFFSIFYRSRMHDMEPELPVQIGANF